MDRNARLNRLGGWFASHGWEPFPFQLAVWQAYADGHSGLIHSATGTGKTLAAWLGPVAEGLGEDRAGIKVLWITPLRALAADTVEALRFPLLGLGSSWRVEQRTGDTSYSAKERQRKSMPDALVTTPESLSLMLSYPEWSTMFEGLRCVVVDEWHELMSSKRGVQTELGIARLRTRNPDIRLWGVSATLSNLDEAMGALLGEDTPQSESARLIQGDIPKQVIIDTILPERSDRFTWAGHMGTSMVPHVVREIEQGGTSLVFTNTRAQAENWYQGILGLKPEWADTVGLHHGSLSREVRDQVEAGLKQGLLRSVVCTSSLDLGVDFSPVNRVIQVGSPKGVARLLQRAGRSGHRPGEASRVTCVPTHALELIDICSARVAAERGEIEGRSDLDRPLDVLVQHLVTVAAGEGFHSSALLEEVRTTRAYRHLSDEEWQWALDFVTKGGKTLAAYPEFHKVVQRGEEFKVEDREIAKRHRMSIGTIVSDASIKVQYMSGGVLGSVEESFIARLRPGDKFLFAGRPLSFVRVKDMVAYVRRATSTQGAVPRWMGGRLPLSGELAAAIRRTLDGVRHGEINHPELESAAPLLEVQQRWSEIPAEHQLLIERTKTREGHHIFLYPFEGRMVHEGLAAVFAYRISRLVPITFSLAYNDYGLELLSREEAPLEEAIEAGLLSPANLAEHIAESLNAIELSRRQFREIARVAGLVFEGYPYARKTARQLQGSSGLFYDVFLRYDPDNLLLEQANREVLERQLEHSRMARALARLYTSELRITRTARPTPFAFPILVDRLRSSLTSESLPERISAMSLRLEREADKKGRP